MSASDRLDTDEGDEDAVQRPSATDNRARMTADEKRRGAVLVREVT
jgi:hypothetical protein